MNQVLNLYHNFLHHCLCIAAQFSQTQFLKLCLLRASCLSLISQNMYQATPLFVLQCRRRSLEIR